MLLVPTSTDGLIHTNPSFNLAGNPVGAALCYIVLDETEKKNLIQMANYVWSKISVDCPDFIGHIRFDFVPSLSGEVRKTKWRHMDGYDLGPLSICGVYEINSHAPECAAATAVLHESFDDLMYYQPSAAIRLAQVIRDSIGPNIGFIAGTGLVKNHWKDALLSELSSKLKILEIHGDYSSWVWRWGDFRFDGDSTEFHEHDHGWLLKKNKIFNTIANGRDPSNKGRLMPDGSAWDQLVGQNRLLSSEEDINWAVENQNNLICKPTKGASGTGVLFGRKENEWEKLLNERMKEKNHALYEAKWLPKISLPEGEFALDINPSFWVWGGKLQYLYTISRIDFWDNYWERGVINVAKGAGFAGTLVDY